MVVIKIKIDIVVVNLFLLGAKEVSLDQLAEISAKIKESIPHVFVYFGQNIFADMVNKKSNMFALNEKGDAFCRGSWFDPAANIDTLVLMDVPKEVKPKMRETLIKILNDGLSDEFQYIFSPEYIEENFNFRLPEQHRETVMSIIQESFKQHQLANSA